MFVNVTLLSQVSALSDTAIAYVTIDGVNSSNVGHDATIAFSARSRFNISFQVMPGSTYAINTLEAATGFVSKGAWIESH